MPSGAHLGGPWSPRWAPEGREVSHSVVVIDRFRRMRNISISSIVGVLCPISCCGVSQHICALSINAANTLQWRHHGHDGVSNHQPHDYLRNRYSGTDQRKHQSSASLAFVRGFHRTGEFPAQRASNAENVSIWWRHHVSCADVMELLFIAYHFNLKQIIRTAFLIAWHFFLNHFTMICPYTRYQYTPLWFESLVGQYHAPCAHTCEYNHKLILEYDM